MDSSKFIEYLQSETGMSPYSGRGMYGKSCVSISGESRELQRTIAHVLESFLADAFERGQEEEANRRLEDGEEPMEYEYPELHELQEMARTLVSFSSDAMGLNQVYYWPSVKWVKEEV